MITLSVATFQVATHLYFIMEKAITFLSKLMVINLADSIMVIRVIFLDQLMATPLICLIMVLVLTLIFQFKDLKEIEIF